VRLSAKLVDSDFISPQLITDYFFICHPVSFYKHVTHSMFIISTYRRSFMNNQGKSGGQSGTRSSGSNEQQSKSGTKNKKGGRSGSSSSSQSSSS
jgi:hypothetical protein